MVFFYSLIFCDIDTLLLYIDVDGVCYTLQFIDKNLFVVCVINKLRTKRGI